MLETVWIMLLMTCFQTGQSDLILVWSDEFNSTAGTALDSTYWNYEIGDGSAKGIPGWGNSELQYYTDSVDNVASDGDGHLALIARKENSSTYPCHYGPCKFTSGRIISKFSHQYGRFEARIKAPEGQGLWPAFWLLGANVAEVGWPACGEIDIMELKGRNPRTVSGALHGPGYSGGQSISKSTTLKSGPSFTDAFHLFALDWHPHSITWSVDGQAYQTRTLESLGSNLWVFDHPFNVLLNFAVGGHFDGPPTSNVTFPQALLIDYIRIYDYGENSTASTKGRLGTTTTSLPGTAGSASAVVVIYDVFCLTPLVLFGVLMLVA